MTNHPPPPSPRSVDHVSHDRTPTIASLSSVENEKDSSSVEKNHQGTLLSNSKQNGIGGNEREQQAPGITDFLFPSRRRRNKVDLDGIATQPSVFDDPEKSPFYQPHPKWENLHRFNPAARWTWREETKIIKKVDKWIACWAILMFFCLDLDRSNISQANSDNLLPDLGITTQDYNLGNTLFRIGFLSAELPSQMISKKIGSDVWVPAQLVLWSIFSAAQFWMNGRSQFLAFRFIIGLLQGGFIPDVILWLSYFYKKTELPLRLALFWVSNFAVDIIGPFAAFGLLRLRGRGGYEGWRYLFLIEGVFTLIVGIFSFVMMPSSPTTTKTWFWRKGWFTEREEEIMVNRIIRDDPTKGSMHNRQGLSLKALWKSLCDYDLWPMYMVGLFFGLPGYPVASYLTLNLRRIGFSTLTTNLLTIPSPVLGLFLLILITVISERFNNRSFVAMAQNIWYLPFMVALYTLPSNTSPWTYWAVSSLTLAAPYVHAIQVAWISRQSGSVRTRTVSASVYNMFVQVSSIIGANVYQSNDAPLYRKGNLALTVIAAFNILLYAGVSYYYKWRNASRDRIWNGMTKEEQDHYLRTTKDEGNRRLDFRFAY
ncbi:MFS general substrate transporter [Violaceomyces palustris]|uniref:MFS general substrate transporter n=1 Tax=Violaceomyces palustris TaxID=1673888 RepID=A0ACD0NTK2_9BASI|nr:MFS general substrate transporter [Violaceomyces palustris]